MKAETDTANRLPIMEQFERAARASLERQSAADNRPDVAENRKADANLRAERAAWLRQALDVPARYKDATLTAEPAAKWKAIASPEEIARHKEFRGLISSFTRSHGMLALIGKRGTGKTHLAWAALIDAAKSGRSGKFIKAADLFIDIEGTWKKGTESSLRKILDKLIRPRVLVIDELSEMQADKDWQAGRLTYIIDRRYDAKLATLLISNDTEEMFFRNLGESATSRMREKGRVLFCDWPSFRETHGHLSKPN